MSRLILLVVIVFVVFMVLAALKGKQPGGTGAIGFPYLPARFLFSAAERSFLGVLDQAVGPEHRVFGKVRVADLASVKPGLGSSARQGALIESRRSTSTLSYAEPTTFLSFALSSSMTSRTQTSG
jgi:hypothetical protein